MKRGKIRNKITNVFLVFVLLVCTVVPSNALAYTVGSEDRLEEPIAEGVTLETIAQYTSEGTLRIYVMKVDLTNPYVKIDTMTGPTGKLTGATGITKMTAEAGAVAGINGDFFQMDEKAPIGLTVKDGNIISSPAQRTDMYGFGITGDKVPMINIFSFQGQVQAANGQVFPISGVNKPTYLAVYGASSDKDRLNLYTPQWGEKSRGKLPEFAETVEVVVENDVVKEIRTNLPPAIIPPGGYVLAANGTAAAWVKGNLMAGTGITSSYQILPDGDKLAAAVGGQAMLVNYGKRSWFTQNITGKKARTAIGYTEDRKTMYLVVVEGGSQARGMTQEELADFMVSLGCWQALNLDGGGSSTMAARLLGDDNISLVNRPVYTTQRQVPNGIGLFSTAPAGNFAGLKIRGDRWVIKGISRSYIAKGYDEHFNPYQVAPEQITWSVEPNLGSFNDGNFTATGRGTAEIKASYNGITASQRVNILGYEDIATIQVSPASISLNENESTELSVVVTTRNGVKLYLKGSEVDWEVTGNIGKVEEATFKAAGQKGLGQLTAAIDGFKTSIPVTIGSTEKPFSGLEAYKDYNFSGYPVEVTGSFRAVSEGEPVFRGTGAAVLEYDFTQSATTSAAYGKFGRTGLMLPGQPLGLGVWVYGDQGNNHWLRAAIQDANGTEKIIDLAKNVNWKGWKQVTGKFPTNLKYPIKLNSIYLVETDVTRLNKGSIVLDELTLLMPVTGADLVAKPEPIVASVSVNAGQETKGIIGNYLMASIPANGIMAEQLELVEETSLQLATPGFNPILPAFKITGKANNTDMVVELTKPMVLSYQYPATTGQEKLRMFRWNPDNQIWVQVPHKNDENARTITAKTEQYGLFAVMEDVRPAPQFNDVEKSWAREQITAMAAKRLVSGFPGGKFLPDKGVTRAEFVVLLSNFFGWSAAKGKPQFKDSIPEWAAGPVGAAVEKGIVAGYADGTFKPGKIITRAEMAAIIDQCLQLPDSDKPSAYADASHIPGWAVQAIRDTKVTGLLAGHNNKFRPMDTASRAEATAVLSNMLNYYLD